MAKLSYRLAFALVLKARDYTTEQIQDLDDAIQERMDSYIDPVQRAKDLLGVQPKPYRKPYDDMSVKESANGKEPTKADIGDTIRDKMDEAVVDFLREHTRMGKTSVRKVAEHFQLTEGQAYKITARLIETGAVLPWRCGRGGVTPGLRIPPSPLLGD